MRWRRSLHLASKQLVDALLDAAPAFAEVRR